jgi:hypothetical protein
MDKQNDEFSQIHETLEQRNDILNACYDQMAIICELDFLKKKTRRNLMKSYEKTLILVSDAVQDSIKLSLKLSKQDLKEEKSELKERVKASDNSFISKVKDLFRLNRNVEVVAPDDRLKIGQGEELSSLPALETSQSVTGEVSDVANEEIKETQ